jgi:cystathionine beta-lyase/cystathionine gamma-synthase
VKIAQWCAERREVRAVHYAGLPAHPDHEVAAEQMNGFGGMMGLELSGGGRAADRFVRKLRLIRHAPIPGGVDSLVSEPRFTSHTHLSAEERANRGLPDGFLRLSVGIEDASDLIADIEHALR